MAVVAGQDPGHAQRPAARHDGHFVHRVAARREVRQQRVARLVIGRRQLFSEDPWIRQTFEGELAKRGLTTLMPEEAYREPGYQWTYA